MKPFRFVALTPPGLTDPGIAIAAGRAGELGVLNLEFTQDVVRARAAIERLAELAAGAVGIRLDGADAALVRPLLAELPGAVGTVILTAGDGDALPGLIETARASRREVWIEVTAVEQARAAAEYPVCGVIAKGEESGGWVGTEGTFILLQRLLDALDLPVWAYGGIGLHTAAACAAAGAAGVVLDLQLALTRESPLPQPVRSALAALDGSETELLGAELGSPFRVYTRPRLRALREAADQALALAAGESSELARAEWREATRSRVGWAEPEQNLWPIGQDAAFAGPLAERYHTVAGVLGAMRAAVAAHLEAARELRPLQAGSPLAASHGTRYPIVQGPMTRVSDVAPFAESVAEAGGLPFLALALMRAPEVEILLAETQQRLGERAWGVGILGFVPLELRREQLEIVRRYRPPFALIAGGRPDQAQALEQEGIATYLHVPSPGLLELFLRDGARRFVFEGRECGGHVGPRSSFVLWNSTVDVLLEHLPSGPADDCHVLFAGGIHDGRSAAMVAALAAPLAARGVRVGILMGTAYLFTEEAVSAGAVLPGFQRQALEARTTVLVASGPGHAVRCVGNAYTEEFERVGRQLRAEGRSADEIRRALEDLNIGRLRVAAKGVDRNPAFKPDSAVPKLIAVDEETQAREGMYMIGQVAALRDRIGSIAELHEEVARGSMRLLGKPASVEVKTAVAPRPSRVAIVGISCLLPRAPDLAAYWENIVRKVYAIGEIPAERWNADLYFDAERSARDKIYSRWGGFLDEVPFDPLEFGMPPAALRAIDPMQLLALVAAKSALRDAGYLARPFERSRASVILGMSGGLGELGAGYCLRAGLPLLLGDAAADLIARQEGLLPEWTEDSFAGLLLNVTAGRIANRFDLGGVNYTVDAACASSLTAVHLAVGELETGTSDLVLTGGVDTVQQPFGYLCFSKTQALSPTGQPRTFDASADGIVISEGVVMLVLKRLDDAERDGDRIYAVIQSVAGSSDGRAKGLTAPRPEGQVLALRRAYDKAGFSPTTVGLFEAHGTGTVVGDRTEALSLSTFLEQEGAAPAAHAVGSVKSMIGHTKSTAGVAGLAKVALALHQRVLPPTLGVTQPNPRARFGEGPLYLSAETRPWIHTAEHPRRAGVSAFGFGGTNFHAVVEEYSGDFLPRRAVSPRWPSELLLWSGDTREEVARAVSSLQAALEAGARPELHDLAHTLGVLHHGRPAARTLAVVATSLEELRDKLELAQAALLGGGSVQDPRGIYFSEAPVGTDARIAFLFPGQGSQYPNMHRELAVYLGEVREVFECADRVLAGRLANPLSSYVFPRPVFTEEAERSQQAALTRTDVAQPALGASSVALLRLLRRMGIRADALAGHSYGEYVALHAAGVYDEATLLRLSEQRGRCIFDAAESDRGTMAAVSAGSQRVAEALEELPEVWIANLNAPDQTVISGSSAGIERALERCAEAGLKARRVPVSCAFHSPLVEPAQACFADALKKVRFSPPVTDVFANSTAAVYPQASEQICALLREHLVRPVRFAEQVEAMYESGCRIFVEVGPKAVLTGLVRRILGERPHLAVATDQAGRGGVLQLQHALGQLASEGVRLRLEPLFEHREVRSLDLARLVEQTAPRAPSQTTWMITGGTARPFAQPPGRPQPIALPPASAPRPGATAAGGQQDDAPGMGTADGAATAERRVDPAVRPAPPSVAAEVMLRYQALMGEFLEGQREVMSRFVQAAVSSPPRGTAAPVLPPADPVAAPDPAPMAAPRRMRQVEHELPPLPAARPTFDPARPILLTDDGGGIAESLAVRIRGCGGTVSILHFGDALADAENGEIITSADPRELAAAVQRLRSEVGPIGGVVHLRPGRRVAVAAPDQDGGSAGALERWRAGTAGDVKCLFAVLRAAAGDLQASDAPHPNRVVAAALRDADGQVVAPDDPAADLFAWDSALAYAALAGMLRTVAAEWPGVGCKALLLESGAAPDALADTLLREIAAADGETAVAYRRGGRFAQRTEEAPLAERVARDAPLGPESVVLLTGGLRGITAEVALHLADKYRPRLVIAGRSPLPEAEEPEWLVGLEDGSQVRAALIRRARQSAAGVTVGEIEASSAALLRERELRRNLARLRGAGASVEYAPLDVRDAVAVAELVAGIRRRHGRLDGVIHGAGVVEDRRIEEKTPDSFDRVFDTKVDGAWALSRALRPGELRFFVLFSSAVATYGNPGQADYAAANATLDALARRLDGQWPGRVVALEWGPWRSGMVTPELERRFAEREIALLDVRAGCAALEDELRHGGQGEPVVIIAGGTWGATPESADRAGGEPRRIETDALPLLVHADVRRTGNTIEVIRTLDPVRDLFLRDHVLDGRPVLPMAGALELMVETAQAGWPELQVTAVRDLRVLKGVVLESGPVTLQVSARSMQSPARERTGAEVEVEIRIPRRPERLHYRATVELGSGFPLAPAAPTTRAALSAFPLPLEQAYAEWLFHGPIFRGIREVTGMNDDEVAALLAPSAPGDCISGTRGAADWLIDPVVLDSALQTVVLWARARHDVTILPTGFARLRRYGRLKGTEVASIAVTRRVHDALFRSDVQWLSPQGEVLAVMEGAEAAGSRALNRLTARPRGSAVGSGFPPLSHPVQTRGQS